LLNILSFELQISLHCESTWNCTLSIYAITLSWNSWVPKSYCSLHEFPGSSLGWLKNVRFAFRKGRKIRGLGRTTPPPRRTKGRGCIAGVTEKSRGSVGVFVYLYFVFVRKTKWDHPKGDDAMGWRLGRGVLFGGHR